MTNSQARTTVLWLSALLLVVGAALSLRRPRSIIQTTVEVAVAQQSIEPYTLLTRDSLSGGVVLSAAEAAAMGAYPIEHAVGLMSTSSVEPGGIVTASLARPVQDVRFTRDLSREIISFAAPIDRLVSGAIRPGHLINVYGYAQDENGEPFTELVQPKVLVVGVAAGSTSIGGPIERPNLETGVLEADPGAQRSARPVTLVTVAVEPRIAIHLIDSLSARNLSPWITLAAAGEARATPGPPTPLPQDVVWIQPTWTPGPTSIGITGGGGAANAGTASP